MSKPSNLRDRDRPGKPAMLVLGASASNVLERMVTVLVKSTDSHNDRD